MRTIEWLSTSAVLAACGGGVRHEPAARPPPASAPPARVAVAELRSVAGDVPVGVVTFEPEAGGVIFISGVFGELGARTVRAFYVHERGDCDDAGGHLDPTGASHGPPASSERHAGDFGNLIADEDGNARFAMRTDSVTLEDDDPDSVLGRAFVIHVGPDSLRGDAGDAFACGVIRLAASAP